MREENVEAAMNFIREKLDVIPHAAVILGSGLSSVVEEASIVWALAYEEIPGFPNVTAPGHSGKLILSHIEKGYVLFFQGRFHYYEGHAIQTTVFPVKLAAHLGIKKIVLTNAAGSINPSIPVGSLVLLEDHLSFFLPSPLRGENDDAIGPRFPDMTAVYSASLRDLAKEEAEALAINLHTGIYAYMPGPQYESPAEIRALRSLGADLVGMSTVAEAITARHAGMEILGLSTVTNLAAGLEAKALSHENVLQEGKKMSQAASRLLARIVKRLSAEA